MYPSIYKYFLLHKKLNIPGIGCFVIKNTTATFKENNSVIQPPIAAISFNTETALADKSFFKFLSNDLHINEVDAIKHFHDFAYQLQNGIARTEGIILPGMGILKKQPTGGYFFEEENYAKKYSPAIVIDVKNAGFNKEKITSHQTTYTLPDNENSLQDETLTNEALEEKSAKDYWWIFAIVLAVVGIAAIAYKLYSGN